MLARYGGEEFAIILPATPKTGAQLVAERVRQAVAGHDFPGGAEQPGGRLTVSLGIATHPADAPDSRELVQRADLALYEAKAQGRDRVCVYARSLRSFARTTADLEGHGRFFGSADVPLRVVEIGEGGMRVRTARPVEADALVDIWFRLPPTGRSVRVSGRVLRSSTTGTGEYEAALRIVDIAAADRWSLGQFVRSSAARDEE